MARQPWLNLNIPHAGTSSPHYHCGRCEAEISLYESNKFHTITLSAGQQGAFRVIVLQERKISEGISTRLAIVSFVAKITDFVQTAPSSRAAISVAKIESR
jgi:hypothetical protein